MTKKFKTVLKICKSEIANYQDSVSSGNDELTSIGLESKIVNAAVRKYFASELPQKERKISAEINFSPLFDPVFIVYFVDPCWQCSHFGLRKTSTSHIFHSEKNYGKEEQGIAAPIA